MLARLYIDAAAIGLDVQAYLSLDFLSRHAVMAEHNARNEVRT